MKKNILIAHGGGPTVVINGSLFGVLDEARKYTDQIGEIYGAIHGIEGVLNEELMNLSQESKEQIDLLPYTPSSAIGTCRRKLSDDDYPRILEVFKQYNIGYFFYNGGNDSMDTCNKIEQLSKRSGYDLVTVGIPKTIDNDLDFTDHCPGYGSAARFIANNTRDLWMEVQANPMYVTIMETMGRNAGWLTAAASLPRYKDKPCAQLIYLPERPFEKDRFLADVEQLLSKQRSILIVASEGLRDSTGKMISDLGVVDGFGHTLAGGSAQVLRDLITENLGVRARAESHGFLGRASMVMQSEVDREEAVAVGRYALQLSMAGVSGVMVSICRKSDAPYTYSLEAAPLEQVANVEKMFPQQWINEAGNGVEEAFRTYCLPLIGREFPDYTTFKRIPPTRM